MTTKRIGIGSTDSQTKVRSYDVEQSEYVFTAVGSTIASPFEAVPSATTPVARLFNRFSVALAPIAAVAALAAPIPAPESQLRRSVSSSRSSQTAVIDVFWMLDSWSYSEDFATPEQLVMLRSLLSLEATEGLTLDLIE